MVLDAASTATAGVIEMLESVEIPWLFDEVETRRCSNVLESTLKLGRPGVTASSGNIASLVATHFLGSSVEGTFFLGHIMTAVNHPLLLKLQHFPTSASSKFPDNT